MRFMLLLKGDPPADAVPSEELVTAMYRFNQDLVEAGALLSAEGLYSSARGSRVSHLDGRVTVIDGPFTESKELVAGYMIIDVASKAEAIEWARRCPVHVAAGPGREAVVEVRQVAEMAAPDEDALAPASFEERAQDQVTRLHTGLRDGARD